MVKKAAQKNTPVTNEVSSPVKQGDDSVADGNAMEVESGPSEPTYTGLPDAKRKSNRAPTVNDIIVDPITQLASEHWASQKKVNSPSCICSF